MSTNGVLIVDPDVGWFCKGGKAASYCRDANWNDARLREELRPRLLVCEPDCHIPC
jgi:hypothetical protein